MKELIKRLRTIFKYFIYDSEGKRERKNKPAPWTAFKLLKVNKDFHPVSANWMTNLLFSLKMKKSERLLTKVEGLQVVSLVIRILVDLADGSLTEP